MAKLDTRILTATDTELEMLLDRIRHLRRSQRRKIDANALGRQPRVSVGNITVVQRRRRAA